ncbi:hypothetical protein F383_09378 [Gossypium arboreum]|uniref:Uncharacterized protein n=1 Tax=Gossypium arboreum TaxID=29729 RepID=A0A0B0PB47_GOSAR|nr:hypothetical protein F383_09378 [Gossypium arboreum]
MPVCLDRVKTGHKNLLVHTATRHARVPGHVKIREATDLGHTASHTPMCLVCLN